MIQYSSGDLFQSETDALVNSVNCVGIMGKGVALQFKKAFPENFKQYKAACARGDVMPGKMFITKQRSLTAPRLIINFPTKRHWRGNSRIEDLEIGLIALREAIKAYNISSIALPALGSGLGGLNWSDVRKLIEEQLQNVGIPIIVYEPGNSPTADNMKQDSQPPKMTKGRAALIMLIHRYLSGLLDPEITLLEIHKLMYFMQESGEPLSLDFVKSHYGPYANNLHHVLNRIEGYYTVGYADGGDYPKKQITLIPGSVVDAEALLKEKKDTRDRFDRVSKLVSGFESSSGMELLATAHWLISRENNVSLGEVIAGTYSWAKQKKRFSKRQIRIAFNRLRRLGWISSKIRLSHVGFR